MADRQDVLLALGDPPRLREALARVAQGTTVALGLKRGVVVSITAAAPL